MWLTGMHQRDSTHLLAPHGGLVVARDPRAIHCRGGHIQALVVRATAQCAQVRPYMGVAASGADRHHVQASFAPFCTCTVVLHQHIQGTQVVL